MNESTKCSCGGDLIDGHRAGCTAYEEAVRMENTPGWSCCPNGGIWPITKGLVFQEKEGSPVIESSAHAGQYLSNLESMMRRGNIPQSQPEFTLPAGTNSGSIIYSTTQTNDGYALPACVLVSFSLPKLTSASPDVTFSLGTSPPGLPEPTAFAGEQIVAPTDIPIVQALEPDTQVKYRFIMWGAQRLFSRTAITNWLLQAPTRNGMPAPPRKLKFVMEAVGESTFKVEMVQVGSVYYKLITRLAALLKQLGRGTELSLADLNTLLSTPQAMAGRAMLLTAAAEFEKQLARRGVT